MYECHIILDFEMNPVLKDPKEIYNELRNEIIEIGAVKLDKDLNIVGKFDRFVKPQYNYQVTPYITRLTGIHSVKTLNAPTLELVLPEFVQWIGNSPKTRIYSWSDNDFFQLKTECQLKNILFPSNMKIWRDFQKVFPKMMHIQHPPKSPMALKEAIRYSGITVDSKKVHSALYDSELTTELLIPILNGEYKTQVEYVHTYMNNTSSSSTLGDMCGGLLAALLKDMNSEE